MTEFIINNNTFNDKVIVGGNNSFNVKTPNYLLEKKNTYQKSHIECEEQSEREKSLYRPIVFISYSWGDEAHNKWVRQFAEDIKSGGVKVIYDQDIPYGTPLPNFMTKSIYESDKTLIIGTPDYLRKSREKGTGCQFEDYVITDSIYTKFDTEKFIPILRSGTYDTSFPPLIAHRKGFDFTSDSNYNERIDKLVGFLTSIRI